MLLVVIRAARLLSASHCRHPSIHPSTHPSIHPKVTLGYNIARMKEAAGDLKAAAAEYEQLLEKWVVWGWGAGCYFDVD